MSALQQFQRIETAYPHAKNPIKYYYQIGPFVVCLSFASQMLVPLMTRAFSHLKQSTANKADLTIYLWDTATTPNSLPTLDWNLIHRNGYQGYQENCTYLHYFDSIHALSLLNTEKHTAYYVVRDANQLPWWIGGSPLQVILHWWLREQGMQLTHAAAISNENAALVLAGKGGSGKSTTTLSCLTAGLNYLSEDYCLLAEPAQVYSIYQSAKLEAKTREFFPHYDQFISNPHEAAHEKALLFYQDIFPTQIKKAMPLKAIVSLRVGNQTAPIIQACDQQIALKNLMMSTVMQLPIYQTRTCDILKNIVAQVDCYQMTLGQHLSKNIDTIQKLLNEF